MSAIQGGKVKSVLSGDTVVICGAKNPHAERTLSLAYVTAPRLKREGDETFAFESRDFIRRQLVGKVIQFQVLYTLPTGNKRDYGTITLQSGQQLPDLSVAEGWLKLRDDAGKREESEEGSALIERLRVYESRAKADGKGMWDSDGDKVQTAYELPDPKAFVQQWKGTALDAIVEKVLTGDRLIVRLVETPTKHVQTMVLIAGIRAPSTKKVNPADGQEQRAEPYGDEAQFFVDFRLMQRNVKVQVLGVSPQNQLIATVLHPNGNIAVFALEEGLARCVDHHSTLLGSEMTTLRNAEKTARDARKGLFEGHVRKTGGSQADAVVSRVQSADTIFVKYHDGAEKRINLSSVRQPKPTDPKQSPFAAEAKEFARKILIGKHVKVSIDGKRPASEGFDERDMATISQNNRNIALVLAENGHVSVLRHRMDDQDRSPIYDDLLLAESTAQAEGKGMWSGKTPETRQYIDYSESLEKAKRLLTLLQRQRRIPAVVDFVKGAARFTLLIPRENAKITFVLSGIQAPKSARNDTDKAEPFGKEAHELASKRLQQRDVEIDVEDTDRVGGFIGKLYVNHENFAKVLLEDGFATVRGYSAEKSGNATELFAAETKAKEARKGLWHDYDPSQEVDDATGGQEESYTNGNAKSNGDSNGVSTSQAAPSKDYRDVVVTHVDDSCRLKIQQISNSTTGALSSLMNAFRAFHLAPANSKLALSGPPKAGDLVAAKFSEDGAWYRARIRRNDREAKTAEVLYIDYGNSEVLPWSVLRPLGGSSGAAAGSADKFGAQALKAQAQEAALSFVQFPSGSEQYLREAQEWLLRRSSESAQLVARVDHTDTKDNTLWVTLFDPQAANGNSAGGDSSINAEAVEEGLAMVGRKLSRWERAQGNVLDGLKKLEAEAKAERRGMWEYGDLTED